MLVLSRKTDEAIVIGDNIEVTVLSIRGNRVRLGIKAPNSVTVHRMEVHQHQQEFDSIDLPADSDWDAARDISGNDLTLTC